MEAFPRPLPAARPGRTSSPRGGLGVWRVVLTVQPRGSVTEVAHSRFLHWAWGAGTRAPTGGGGHRRGLLARDGARRKRNTPLSPVTRVRRGSRRTGPRRMARWGGASAGRWPSLPSAHSARGTGPSVSVSGPSARPLSCRRSLPAAQGNSGLGRTARCRGAPHHPLVLPRAGGPQPALGPPSCRARLRLQDPRAPGGPRTPTRRLLSPGRPALGPRPRSAVGAAGPARRRRVCPSPCPCCALAHALLPWSASLCLSLPLTVCFSVSGS